MRFRKKIDTIYSVKGACYLVNLQNKDKKY